MTTSTVYATLEEFLALPDITSEDEKDDTFINDLLTRASRDGVDGYCQQWFYSYTQTRYFDMPHKRELVFDKPLLSCTSLTNGDGNVLSPTLYILTPYNGIHYDTLKLKQSSAQYWMPGPNGTTEGVITVAGTWGYVDRASASPEALPVIQATKDACLIIARDAYKKRYGVGTAGVARVTAAGVVITPQGIPAEAKILLDPLRNYL